MYIDEIIITRCGEQSIINKIMINEKITFHKLYQ